MTAPERHTYDDDGSGYACKVCQTPESNARHLRLTALSALDTPAPSRMDAPATSRAAGKALNTGSVRGKALDQIFRTGAWGSTDDEAEQATGIAHSSFSSARGYLAEHGFIENKRDADGRKVTRPTRGRNRPAEVWVITPLGRAKLSEQARDAA